MSKYLELQNKYEFPSQDWYTFNDMMYICNLIVDEAEFPVEVTDDLMSQFMAAPTEQDRTVIFDSLMYYLGSEDPSYFQCPQNVFADIIKNTTMEDLPKVMYLLDNPDKKAVPSTFNALTHPDYFKYNATQEEDYSSREIYNDVLKRSLDVRNNNLDARKFNTGMTPEQIVAMANNKMDLTAKITPAEVLTPLEGGNTSNQNNLYFSPNSIVNSGSAGNDKVLSNVDKLQKMARDASTNEAPKQAQFNLEDLLKKD
jgi:hypothetical protein